MENSTETYGGLDKIRLVKTCYDVMSMGGDNAGSTSIPCYVTSMVKGLVPTVDSVGKVVEVLVETGVPTAGLVDIDDPDYYLKDTYTPLLEKMLVVINQVNN